MGRVEHSPAATFSVIPVQPAIGAEIDGIDLRDALSREQVEHLRKLLIKYKVLFFRDQDVTREQHINFARNFGTLQQYNPPASPEGYPEIHLVYSDRPPSGTDCWHTDGSFYRNPPLGTVLRAVEVPEVGGDTLFVNMAAAYQGLPEKIKQRIASLSAIHVEDKILKLDPKVKLYDSNEASYLSCSHPIVRVHPESGEKILYVNSRNTTRIEGLSPTESDELLDYLIAQASVPEYQVRFRWRKNSIAFWDDRSTQHYGSADYGSAVRRMERVALAF